MKVDANCDGTVDWVRKEFVLLIKASRAELKKKLKKHLSFLLSGRILFLHVVGNSTKRCYDK